jgi:hypothetical protein
MKAITIRNLVIQVDGKKGTVSEVQKIIDVINTALSEANLESQPQIMSSGLDASDIEIQESEE